MSAIFTEVRRWCFHCEGRGWAAAYYSHQVALDLLVDAADAVRFSTDEARKLYHLAAKYEDESAKQAEAQQWKSAASWGAIHRRNAIYLRALADAPELTDVVRRMAEMRTTFVRQASHPQRLTIVTAEPAS